jgi:hypothetical protein
MWEKTVWCHGVSGKWTGGSAAQRTMLLLTIAATMQQRQSAEGWSDQSCFFMFEKYSSRRKVPSGKQPDFLPGHRKQDGAAYNENATEMRL